MLFKSAESKCMLQILSILDAGKSKYKTIFKITKRSHITIQNILKYLIQKKFIQREETAYKKIEYEITPKGKVLLEKLEDLKSIL